MSTTAPPAVGAARSARAVLDAAGYTGERLEQLIGAGDGGPLLEPSRAALVRRRLAADDSAAAVLATLLVLGETVDAARAERLLGDGAETLCAAGLAREEAGALAGCVRLVPHGDALLASDLPGAGGGEHVVGAHRASILLGNLTVRKPVARALDIGTGSGIQALMLARHAEHVVATDVTERALAFAAFNLALNGVTNVELRPGNLLEPVAGERFGVAVSNPPYVVSPETSLLFRDSDLPDDDVCATLVAGLPELLVEGGFATVAVSWVQEGDDPARRPRSWVDGRGCDLLVLHSGTDEPLVTATTWSETAADGAERERTVDRWLDYYRARGIGAIAYGVLVLRRRTEGTSWTATLPLDPERIGPAGHQLERIAATRDHVERLGDGLRDAHVRVAPDVRIDERRRREGGGWTAVSRALALDGGLAYTAELDDVTIRVVEALDGTRPVGVVAADVAAAAGLPAQEVEETSLRVVGAMLQAGFAELVA